MRIRWHARALPLVALMTLVVSWAPGCGQPEVMAARDDAFNQGVEALGEGDPLLALRAAWRYFEAANVDEPRYDRALRLMARAAERLDLRYAASIWYLAIAQGGRDAELIPDAIAGIERVVNGGPHDDAMLIGGFVAAQDLAGSLPPRLQAFVDFHAGVDSLRRGERAWAAQRFGRIPRDSPYAWRARYVATVQQIADGALDEAQGELEGMIEEADDPNRVGVADLPGDLRLDVERSLARLHFEAGRWERALQHYDRVRTDDTRDATLLLEMAWSHFHDGHTRRALGLLLAFDAPAFEDVIAPERYLLEAICLRRLCQFEPARRAAIRLEEHYDAAYRALESGQVPADADALVRAARRHRHVQPVTELRASLEAERRVLTELSGAMEPSLFRALDAMYRRGQAEAVRRERERLRVAVIDVANALLAARENVRLVTHELSVALLRGRKRPAGPRERDLAFAAPGERSVQFAFDGEYWGDELDDLLVLAEDRCIE